MVRLVVTAPDEEANVSGIRATLAGARRRLRLAYHLRCAREDARHRGLRVPVGVWFCDHCRLLMWERHAFLRHAQVHAV